MSEGISIWDVLGIPSTMDGREIRRAYARKLKVTQPEDDPEGFQRLRMAYEYALAYAAHAASNETEQPPAESPQMPPPSRVRTPAPIDAEIESEIEVERKEVQRLFDALAARLEKNAREGWPDVDGDARALTALVRGPALRNIHLQMQVEEAVAALILQHAPHADHLLAPAARHFEWRARQHESSLCPPARAVLERIDDLELLDFLKRANNEASRAYETLKKPKSRLARWWSAFEGHEAELAMLHRLRAEHPRLLAELPAENVTWYLNLARLPRPSTAIAFLGIIATIMVMIMVGAETRGGEDTGERVLEAMFVCILGLFGVMLFDYFVIKLPPLLIEERWQGQPPALLSWGWLALSLGVVFGAVAMRGLAWAGNLSLALAVIACYGALLVGGRVPKINWRGTDLLQLRAMRVLLLNAMLFMWVLVVFDNPLHLDPVLLSAFCFVLVGSGISRPFFMRQFLTRFSPRQRLQFSIAGQVIALALIGSAWVFGRNVAFKPWLMAAVVAVVLVRRAIPHGIAIDDRARSAIPVIFVGWFICAWLRSQFDLEVSEQEYGDPPILVTGALFFLGGAVYSFGRAIHDAVKELREPRAAGEPVPS